MAPWDQTRSKLFSRCCLPLHGNGPLGIDGIIGPNTIKALQLWLNAHHYNPGDIDGLLGPITISALQRFLSNELHIKKSGHTQVQLMVNWTSYRFSPFSNTSQIAARIRAQRMVSWVLSRKIWSGEKIGPAGPILATKSGPAGPKMTPKFVRTNQNWSGHITP